MINYATEGLENLVNEIVANAKHHSSNETSIKLLALECKRTQQIVARHLTTLDRKAHIRNFQDILMNRLVTMCRQIVRGQG
ncbi:hypothetical protein FO440_22335 [Mucilaginibacter corticis]|uniref:Uncharacterized protein n=1 Tax=Mucilaginibacter corticis TaxID=2597670 RepID=A0A556M9I4_9SPHI|nr:hypothetical protein [Mucilaginibacter corticis]TSJ36569.1 hypothetical protein FO440_22335 [Mucilaginibacter corticis]